MLLAVQVQSNMDRVMKAMVARSEQYTKDIHALWAEYSQISGPQLDATKKDVKVCPA